MLLPGPIFHGKRRDNDTKEADKPRRKHNSRWHCFFFFFFFPVAAHYCGIVCLGRSVFVPSLLLQLRSRGSDTAGHHHRRHSHSSLELDCNLRRSLTSVCVRTKMKSLRDDRKMLTIAQKVGLLDTRKEGRSYAAVGAPLQNKWIFGLLHKEKRSLKIFIIIAKT